MFRQDVTIQRELSYLTPDRREKLDLYLPPSRVPGTRSPGIVIIHGGGWTGGSKSAGRELNIGTTLAKAGYVCVSIDYRLDANGRWPTNVHDCKNAVRYLRANAEKLGIDVNHIGVIGGSAGGHLALMLGVTDGIPELEPPAPYPGVSSRVQAVVNLYGIADVREWRNGNTIFGNRPAPSDAELALASPMTHLKKGIPPILSIHGDNDPTVNLSQSQGLDRRMKELKLDHQLIVLPGIGHTFDLQTWNKKPLPMDLRPIVTGFFDKWLKPTR
jgi:acetyl esterase/lipase